MRNRIEQDLRPPGCNTECNSCTLLGMAGNVRADHLNAITEKYLAPFQNQLLPIELSSNELHYRKRILLHVEADNVLKQYRLGHLKIAPDFTEKVIDLTSCPIHTNESNAILTNLKQNLFNHFDSSLPLRIRYMYLNDHHLCLVLKIKRSEWKQSRESFTQVIDQITAGISNLKSVSVNIHESSGNRVFDTKGFECIWGNAILQKRYFDMDFEVEPYGFFQNDEKLWGRAVGEVEQFFLNDNLNPETKSVMDLYSGFGSTMALWKKLKMRAIGVEVSGSAIRAADRAFGPGSILNGQCRNRIHQLNHFQESSKEVFIYLNPSRLGCEIEVIDWILKSPKISRIAYLSCNVKSLRRDLDRLGEKYECRKIHAYEFFPQTEHVEALALLKRRQGF